MTERDRSLLEDLISAIHQQTMAISALAQSNQALVQAMAEAEDEEGEPTTYLDGTPCL